MSCAGTLEDVLYHGASSRCQVRVDEQTVLAVVSAPSPALGVVDPVTWIGTAASAKRVPLHVDARAGGWLLACGKRLGRVGPTWSFAAPGVAASQARAASPPML